MANKKTEEALPTENKTENNILDVAVEKAAPVVAASPILKAGEVSYVEVDDSGNESDKEFVVHQNTWNKYFANNPKYKLKKK